MLESNIRQKFPSESDSSSPRKEDCSDSEKTNCQQENMASTPARNKHNSQDNYWGAWTLLPTSAPFHGDVNSTRTESEKSAKSPQYDSGHTTTG